MYASLFLVRTTFYTIVHAIAIVPPAHHGTKLRNFSATFLVGQNSRHQKIVPLTVLFENLKKEIWKNIKTLKLDFF